MSLHRFTVVALSLVLTVAATTSRVGQAHAAPTVTTSYSGGSLTINITQDGTTFWDGLEVPCDGLDKSGLFTTPTPNWSVTSVTAIAGKTYVIMTRSPATKLTEMVTLNGPTQRGIVSTLQTTLTSVPNGSGVGQASFLSPSEVPALGTTGLVVTAGLLTLLAAALLARRRTARAGGTTA